ncbi:MAG: bifunctional phosphoribosyl-AMP cyclohydrolase/phosphoribosyl-ATP diphosphatase HisIE [Gemmatimonadetes bacterium]|nr:bifunctional phosphoribosyl-AMP cyclohydrolase/phosphoribosyl-ATP diphosphatase HisIE [Gemmatimonadota bacterium]
MELLSLSSLDFSRGDGFVTVIAQDHRTGAVLMVAWADREAMERTIATGEMHYHSRTRGLWHKGGTSGNVQKVVSLTPDCDGDAVLARVIPAGPACHNGTTSCFGEPGRAGDFVGVLQQTIAERLGAIGRGELATSYTQKLLSDRNLRLKKLGEEASELAVACADEDTARAVEEGADVVYHTMVALAALGVTWDDVRSALHARHS